MKKKRVDRTIMIWDQCGQEPLSFVILEGDYTHLDGVYINGDTGKDVDMILQEELSNLICDERGKSLQKHLTRFPLKTARLPFTKVIITGFLP